MNNLDEAQRKTVGEWVAQGLKLSDIQTRLAAELGVTMTYMEVRFLVDDLKLVPKDPEPPKPATPSPLSTPAAAPGTAPAPAAPEPAAPAPPAAATGALTVTVDQLTKPGAFVSGKVTFSDGMQAEWYLDQTGRLGMAAQKQGYRPSQEDVRQFQAALETELAKLGF